MKEGLFSKIIAGPVITFFVFFLIFTFYHSKNLSYFATTSLFNSTSNSFQNQDQFVQNQKIVSTPPQIVIGKFDPAKNFLKINKDNSFIYLKAIQNEKLKNENTSPTLKLEINQSGKIYWKTAKIESWENKTGILYFEADVVKEFSDLNQVETFYTGNYQLIFNF